MSKKSETKMFPEARAIIKGRAQTQASSNNGSGPRPPSDPKRRARDLRRHDRKEPMVEMINTKTGALTKAHITYAQQLQRQGKRKIIRMANG